MQIVRESKTTFYPESWTKTFFLWMKNIEPWCISRQIWWGHRIPAWYDKDGKFYVADSLEDAQIEAGKGVKLTQDNDVLDTWFSSALWPFSTLGWPKVTPELSRFYPTSVLVTGFDIIFFWVARMIMFGLKFAGDVPFKDIYITGLIKDGNGQKMSKSKGNVLDPIDLIDGINLEDLLEKRTQGMMQPKLAEKIINQTKKEFPNGIPSFGTDAIRFTFTALASFGRDIKFDLKRVEGYRNFCNKLWNASRFVLINLESKKINNNAALSSQDKWILSRLQHVKMEVQKHLSDYRLDLMSQTLYEFIWHDYCDWYLELSKPLLEDSQTKEGCEATLLKVLNESLVLLHPIIPFITEEIFEQAQKIQSKSDDKLISQPFPEPQNELFDDNAEAEINWLKDFILGIRKIRGEMNISPGKPLLCHIKNFSIQDKDYIDRNTSTILTIAKLDSIALLSIEDEEDESAIALVGEMKILIPLAGLIDKGAEQERLNKEIEKLLRLKSQFSSKLGNEKFINGAPEAIVDNEKEKLASTERALMDLEQQLLKISKL
ncbi:hypothetical protein CL646_01740 [bacterium]|nr:hypothetical protein [bacterium]